MRQRLLQYTALLLGWLSAGAPLVKAQVEEQQAPSAALHWVRLPGSYDCVDGSALAHAVEAKLQRKLFAPASKGVLILEGYVERDPAGYRSELRMTSSAGALLGTRSLSSEATDCRELSEMVAVVLAIMVDPDADLSAKAPTSPPREAEVKPPATVTVERAAPLATPRAEQRLLVFSRASVGLMPGAGIGLGVAYERALRRWGGMRVEGVGFLEARKELDDSSGMRLRLAHAGLGYCPVWVGSRALRFVGCVGAEIGVRQSEGYGFEPENHRASTLWSSATARVALTLRTLSVLLVQAGAGLFVPFSPELYSAVQADGSVVPVYRQPSLGAAFDVALGVRF